MEIPVLNIGHHKQQSGHTLRIELSNGQPNKGLEVPYLHRHHFYMITLIREGRGEHIIDFEKFVIRPNRLFFLVPGQIHKIKADKSAEYLTVQFTPDFIATHSKRFTGFHGINYMDISTEKADELCHLFRHLLQEKEKKDSNSIILANYLNILLEKIELQINDRQHSQQSKTNPIITKFKRLVEQNYKEKCLVGDYAEKLNISPNYLNILSKRETGISVSSHINDRIMLEARRLVVHSESSISQIAHELGFCDASYFIKRFKEKTGMTPKDFRVDYYKMLHSK